MKLAPTFLFITSLIILVVGCGKTESPPPQPTAEMPPKAADAKPATATLPQVPPPTNLANSLAAMTVTTAAETVAAPVKIAAARAVEITNPLSTVPASAAQANSTLAALSQDQVVQGLQEALGKGLQEAIARLGHNGGFLTNLKVPFPLLW